MGRGNHCMRTSKGDQGTRQAESGSCRSVSAAGSPCHRIFSVLLTTRRGHGDTHLLKHQCRLQQCCERASRFLDGIGASLLHRIALIYRPVALAIQELKVI